MEISDYNRLNDYKYTKQDFEEFNYLLLKVKSDNCDATCKIFNLKKIRNFFELKEKFFHLVDGFNKLIEILLDNEINRDKDFDLFFNGILKNLLILNENLLNSKTNIHYYDTAFLSDILQFEESKKGFYIESEIDLF